MAKTVFVVSILLASAAAVVAATSATVYHSHFVDKWAPEVAPGRGVVMMSATEPAGSTVKHKDAVFGWATGIAPASRLLIGARYTGKKLTAFYVDSNGDGKLTEAEAHSLTTVHLPDHQALQGVQVDVTLHPTHGSTIHRTVILTPGSLHDLANYYVRGYYQCQVQVAGAKRAMDVVDEDLDGKLTRLGSDLVLLDANGDGKIEKNEVHSLGTLLTLKGVKYAPLVAPDASTLQLLPRPRGQGKLAVSGPAGAKLTRYNVTLKGEDGQTVHLTKTGQPVSAPAGLYHVASAVVTVRDHSGQLWTYSLSGPDDIPYPGEPAAQLVSLAPGQTLALDLFASHSLTLTMTDSQGHPGDTMMVTLVPKVAYGLTIVDTGGAPAEAVTITPAGKRMAHQSIGFG